MFTVLLMRRHLSEDSIQVYGACLQRAIRVNITSITGRIIAFLADNGSPVMMRKTSQYPLSRPPTKKIFHVDNCHAII